MKPDSRAIGRRVMELRKARNWTLQQLADLAGCTKSHLWAIERGRSTNPTISLMAGLANALGVSLSELIGIPDKPRVQTHLAASISAVRELWERAYRTGFDAGWKAAQPPQTGDAA